MKWNTGLKRANQFEWLVKDTQNLQHSSYQNEWKGLLLMEF